MKEWIRKLLRIKTQSEQWRDLGKGLTGSFKKGSKKIIN